jgi:hypothetical protein
MGTLRAVVGALAIGLVGVGQFWLVLAPEPTFPAVALIAVGILIFLLVVVLKPEAWARLPLGQSRWPTRALVVAGALALSAGATGLSFAYQAASRVNYLPVMVLWFGAMGLFFVSYLDVSWQPDWRAWRRKYGREAVVLALVLLVGAGLRFYALGALPRVINGDEGVLGQAAQNTRTPELASPFALFENFGSLYLTGIALAMEVLGPTPLALRLLPALGGTAAIVAVYLFSRYLFGPRVALYAAILIAVSHAHIHFSRTVAVGYIQGTLLIPLELYFFLSGLKQRSSPRMALSGLLLGLHFNIYLSAQIVLALLVVYLIVAGIVCRPLVQRAWRQVIVLGLGLLVAGLPAVSYALFEPEQFLARLNSDGTFQSGWLAEQIAQTGRSPVIILGERVVHAFLSLNLYPAGDFYGARIPLLDVIGSVLFLIGVVYALWRTRQPDYLLLNGWFWGATVSIGVFSVPASADSYRMLIALPAALVLAAVGLDQIVGALLPLSAPSRARLALPAALLLAVAILNVRAYFYDFAANCRYGGDPQTRFASYLGKLLHTVNREASVALLSDNTFRYGTHSSVDFLSDSLPVTNVPGPVDDLAAEPNTVVIAIASRAEELRAWARLNPGGNLVRQYDCDALMLMAYIIPER